MISHVDEAVTEMFRAVHMQLLGNTCRLEKMLLAALVTETRATGKSASYLTSCLLDASFMPEGTHTTGKPALRLASRKVVHVQLVGKLLAALGMGTRAISDGAESGLMMHARHSPA